jgi:hypothetical protein
MSSGATGSISTSRPSWALGLCDRCGFSFKLNQLYREVYDERENGLLVCRTCLDVDNPQLQLGRQSFPDPQSLYNPRPDTGVPGSTSYFGWMPIGSPLNSIQCQVGNLTVLII